MNEAEFSNLDAAINVVYAEKVSRHRVKQVREQLHKINEERKGL